MEYIFRNSAQKDPIRIRLDDYALSILRGENEEKISYASIISVRINRMTPLVFKMVIQVDGHAPIVLSNWSFTETGLKENQSGAYSLFVRVLHHHLKDKSKAVFKAGKNMDSIWLWAAISVIFAFTVSIATEYLGFSLANPYVQTLIFSALILVLILVFSISKLPKTYNPANIPIQFLP